MSIALVALLLAHLAAAQDAQKRNSLLAKRAGNKSIFQKSTTTTEAAAYEVRQVYRRIWIIFIKKNI